MSLILALLITVVSLVFANNVLAKDNGYDLDFVGEPEYELVNEVTKGGKVIGWSYKINVKIQNTGDTQSPETIVNVTDDEGITISKTTTIDPGETKTIVFNWSTLSSKDQIIQTSFYPSNIDSSHTQYNSGSTSFNMLIGGEDEVTATSTPGFEFLILVLAAIGMVLLKKRR